MSRAALIARADPICAHVNKVLAATSLRSKVDYEKQLPGVISSEQAAAEKLAKLRPPAELASDWSQIVDALRTIATVTTKIDQAAIAGQHENAIHSLLISGQNARLQAMRTARSDGFHDCAQLG
ncbi:MAG TPA: hypothetical protein VFR48_01830 [Solirubrobacteraceae bacterium]|nr:hypothetical protein [Solirubrobacteraceae bacterium]